MTPIYYLWIMCALLGPVIVCDILNKLVNKQDDCPDISNCVCEKERCSIKCTNVMEIPPLPSYVQIVELSDNAIMDVKHENFNHNNITELFLDNNKIKAIDADAFFDLAELKILDLSNNCILTLDKNTFMYNKQLKKLSLRNNPDLSFSTSNLPTSIVELDLMGTNSNLTKHDMIKMVKLRKYYGLYLRNSPQTNKKPHSTKEPNTNSSENSTSNSKTNVEIHCYYLKSCYNDYISHIYIITTVLVCFIITILVLVILIYRQITTKHQYEAYTPQSQ